MLNYGNMTYHSDVVVVGGGFAGLTCALALAKNGKKVRVLEKGAQLGGAFQSFRRHGLQMDTGFHYVGGVGKGEIMRPIIEFFDLADLPWQPLDSPFLEVFVRGKKYCLPRGYDKFIETLSAAFPADRKGLQELVGLMREINEHIYETILPAANVQNNSLMSFSAKTFLETHISSPELRDVLCGQCLTTELTDKLPMYSFLQSINSFIQGSYRLIGGGETLINKLVNNIIAEGGDIITRKNVDHFAINEEGRIQSVHCTDGSEYTAETFISTLHPALTLDCIPECPQMRKIYRRRMRNLANTVGMFTVQLALRPNTIPYRNHSVCILESDDVWQTPCGKGSKVQNLLISYNVPESGTYAANIDLLTPMSWDAVEEWEESTLGHRPEAYKSFKRQKAEECIALAELYFPELQGNIMDYWTSTPLTYRDYTGTPKGTAYGIRKSCDNLLGTVTSPFTPFPNLFLSGQNLMLHGMLGTAMTSLQTCNLICNRNILEG